MKDDNFTNLETTFNKLFGEIDLSIQVVLKCHLLIEQQLDRIIEDFVFHPDHISKANLRYYQKIAIARSLSLDEHENPMWEISIKLNKLRNDFAHLLDSPKRNEKLRDFRDVYFREMKDFPGIETHEEFDDVAIVMLASSHFLGFLRAFHEEIERFRGFLREVDPIVNPHRHPRPETE